MTYKEWMSAMGARFSISGTDVDLILVNQGLNPEEEADVTKAKTALCKEFSLVLPMANVSEGGYSLSWNMEAVKMWYRQMVAELGLPDATAPKIRNRSNVW